MADEKTDKTFLTEQAPTFKQAEGGKWGMQKDRASALYTEMLKQQKAAIKAGNNPGQSLPDAPNTPSGTLMVDSETRSKQNAAVQSFIQNRETELYWETQKGVITEDELKQRTGDLNRIRDRMISSLNDWAGNLSARSDEFESAMLQRFNALATDLDAPAAAPVPHGPATGQEVEAEAFEELPEVEPVQNFGPVNEESVLEKYATEDGNFEFPDSDESPEADENAS